MAVTGDAIRLLRRRLPLRIGALVALALAAGATTWVVVGRTETPAATGATTPIGEPRLVSAAELGGVAATAAPVYWVGPRRDSAYELTQAGHGRTFVRYLSSPTQLGSRRPDFLAVATYVQPNAFAAIRQAAKRPGAITIRPANGGLAVYDRARPTSVFLAYPGGSHQIEVYDPSAANAHRLVRSGAVKAVPLPGVPRVVSRSELSAVAASRGGVFWAGARPGTLVELTETTQGNVFVRYVGQASDVGSRTATFLVVATYPRALALAGIRSAGRRPGAVTLPVPGGGLAVYDRTRPTSIYLAYPGIERQIEVFHPDAREARELVRSGAVVAVP